LIVYWLILEISLILFLPFILVNKLGYEIRIKYFLVQVVGSFLIMFMFIYCLKYLYMFLFILFFKIGIAPFYYWSLYVVEKIEYWSFFFFLSLLKFIPFLICRVLFIKSFFFFLFIFLNCFVGCLGGLGRICLRKLLFYSSLSHNGWLLSCISLRDILWVEYFLVYVLIFFVVSNLFSSNLLYSIKDIERFRTKNFFIVICFLTFRGLPPFRVFIMKFYVIRSLLFFEGYNYIFILILRSLLRLYYYLRVSMSSYSFLKNHKIIVLDLNCYLSFVLLMVLNLFLFITIVFI